MRREVVFLAAIVFFVVGRALAQGHEGDFVVGSSQPGGGQLLIVDWIERRTVPVYSVLCSSGVCLLSAVDPGFIGLPADDLSKNAFALRPNVPVYLEIVSIESGASVRVGGTVLKQGGDRALLGRGATLHVHPSWQLTLPEGEAGRAVIHFRLTSTDRAYNPSQAYPVELLSANAAVATPTPSLTPTPILTRSASPTPTEVAPTPTEPIFLATPTQTPTQGEPSPSYSATPGITPTATPTPTTPVTGPGCPGDCNDDGEVTIDDIVLIVNIALGTISVQACPSADRDHDHNITIEDIISAVALALQGCVDALTARWEHGAEEVIFNRPQAAATELVTMS